MEAIEHINDALNLSDKTQVRIKICRQFYHSIIYTGNDGHRVAIVCIRFGHIKVVSLFIEVSVPNLCQDMRGGCHVFLC